MGFYPFKPEQPDAVLYPSGDTSGIKDSALIESVANANAYTVLGPGQWYIGNPVINQSYRWLEGSGPGTVLNVVPGQAGFGIDGVTQLYLSALAFALGAGSYGLTVAGASDADFRKLFMSGTAAAGGITINGDDATEQSYTDVTFRSVGGTAFGYTRTTGVDTGGLYLDRVRSVSPPSTAAHGFSFAATGAGVGVAANVFMTQCIADSYYSDAMLVSELSKIFSSELWTTMNPGATPGQVALHVTGGFDQVYNGGYAYQALASGTVMTVDGGAHEIQVGGGQVFDGGPGATALGLAGAASGGFYLGTYHNYAGTLTDTPTQFSNNLGAAAPVTYQTSGAGGPSNTLGIADTANPGNEMWIRNSDGTLQFLTTSFSGAPFQFRQSGALQTQQLVSGLAGGGTVSQGSGAPGIPNGVNPNAGDMWLRTDTPGTALQRIYICTAGGGSPTWVGIA